MSLGVYPASVTPLLDGDRLDCDSLDRLFRSFEHAGCAGVVVAGTNGEGPSLSLFEKRDLVREACRVRGSLEVILGVATASVDEAAWLASEAGAAGANAVLAMPPMYYREAHRSGIEAWFRRLLDASPIPVLLYNLPQRTGVAIEPTSLRALADHPKMAGAKDSSGERGNLAAYAEALNGLGKRLYVGNETLLWEALDAGWSGTISGAANNVAAGLVRTVSAFQSDRGAARTEFEAVLRWIEALRGVPQPQFHKAMLTRRGIIAHSDVKLPLEGFDPAIADDLVAQIFGQPAQA